MGVRLFDMNQRPNRIRLFPSRLFNNSHHGSLSLLSSEQATTLSKSVAMNPIPRLP